MGQLESCPDTGKLHWQAYIQFLRPTRFNAAKTAINLLFSYCGGGPAHIECAIGNPESNIDYCSKSQSSMGLSFRLGEPKGLQSSKSSPLSQLGQFVRSGHGLADIVADPQFDPVLIRYVSSIPRFIALIRGSRRDPTTDPIVSVLFGDAGTGKSKKAFEEAPEAYVKPPGEWWDFYDGQSCVILDDFSGNFAPFGVFKRWIDRYPMLVPYKGGFVPLLATQWIITTNHHPSTWWSFQKTGEVGLAALYRRISRIEVFRLGSPRETFDGPLSIELFRSATRDVEEEHKARSRSDFE